MSLMFAKQFSEAGASSGGGGRKGGRGKGSGMMAKSKRGKREQDDTGGDTGSTGLFNMDPNGPYRTHMLFPGRKDEDGSGDPRRSSGSPGFMKAMMSWGKRPSEPRNAAGGSQEMARYQRGTPNSRTESEFDGGGGGGGISGGVLAAAPTAAAAFDPFSRKTVSFHDGVGSPPHPQRRGSDPFHAAYLPNNHAGHQQHPLTNHSYNHYPAGPTTNQGYPASLTNSGYPASPTNPGFPAGLTNQNGHPYYPYNEPFRENDYSTFGKKSQVIANVLTTTSTAVLLLYKNYWKCNYSNELSVRRSFGQSVGRSVIIP